MVEETYGDFVVKQIREAMQLAMEPASRDGEPVEFPETLIFADDHMAGIADEDMWEAWSEDGELFDMTRRMVIEGVLLAIGALGSFGLSPDEPGFVTLADVCASFYARGFVVGLIGGPDYVPNEERMEEFLSGLKEDVDNQLKEAGDLMSELIVFDLEEDN